MNKISVYIITIVLVTLISDPAYAYLDAGSGSMLLQILLGGLAGIFVVFKLVGHKILAIFGIGRKKTPKSKSTDTD